MTMPADLSKRVQTALVLGGIFFAFEILALVTVSGRIILAAFAFLAVGAASYELVTLSAFRSRSSLPLVAPAAATFLWAVSTYFVSGSLSSSFGSYGFGLALGAVFLGMLIVVDARDGLERAERSAFILGVGYILLGLGGGAFVSLSLCPNAVALTLWLLAVVCCNDIAAYFGGARFGGPKLSSNLSPKKTVSGSICGFLAGAVASFFVCALGQLFDPYFPLRGTEAVGLALLVVAGAQVGDLLKSLIKRVYGVKDSGTLLPGHGGVLDRIDGLLGGAPLLLGWIMWRSL